MRTEPERQLLRRIAPFGPPALVIAFMLGWVFGGPGAAWSAAIGILIVAANFVASALAMSRAAKISTTAIFGVAMGGFVVRLGVIVAIMFALNTLPWFSPVAFALAVVPATVLLLGFEMKLINGPIGQQWNIPEGSAR